MALYCCICGNKIGIMDSFGSLSEEYSKEKICNTCMSKKRELCLGDYSKFTDSQKYFEQFFKSQNCSKDVIKLVRVWINQGQNILNEASINQQQEEERIKFSKDFMLTSGYNFEGYKIRKYNGVVSGEVVMGTGFLSEISASINDLLGSTSEEFSKKMKKTKEIATSRMIESAISKGGNAIIGVDFDYMTFGNNMIAVSANGTSVIIEKQCDN